MVKRIQFSVPREMRHQTELLLLDMALSYRYVHKNNIEEEGYEPQNLTDGILTTAYKPNTNNGEITSGSITYNLSENTDVNKINIVQSGNDISNAKVMVRTGLNDAGEGIWQEVGVLNKSLNEIVNTKYDNIFAIRIDWEGIAPTIYEIVTINN